METYVFRFELLAYNGRRLKRYCRHTAYLHYLRRCTMVPLLWRRRKNGPRFGARKLATYGRHTQHRNRTFCVGCLRTIRRRSRFYPALQQGGVDWHHERVHAARASVRSISRDHASEDHQVRHLEFNHLSWIRVDASIGYFPSLGQALSEYTPKKTSR